MQKPRAKQIARWAGVGCWIYCEFKGQAIPKYSRCLPNELREMETISELEEKNPEQVDVLIAGASKAAELFHQLCEVNQQWPEPDDSNAARNILHHGLEYPDKAQRDRLNQIHSSKVRT